MTMTSNIVIHSRPACASLNYSKGSGSHTLWRSQRKNTTNKRLMLPINASFDEDFRSSRNIAISLFRRYRNVVDRGGTDNLKEFICAGVNAYALGCTDDGLRKELINLKEFGVEIEGLDKYGGRTSLKYKIFSEERSIISAKSESRVLERKDCYLCLKQDFQRTFSLMLIANLLISLKPVSFTTTTSSFRFYQLQAKVLPGLKASRKNFTARAIGCYGTC